MSSYQTFILFFTQAEGGAPGFLSREGENAAEALANSMATFIQDSLGIDVVTAFDERVQQLSKLSAKDFPDARHLNAAIQHSLQLFPDILLMAGEKPRSQRTAEMVANQLGLPVIVDARLDPGEKELAKRPNSLGTALEDTLLRRIPTVPLRPKILLIGTHLDALTQWLHQQQGAAAETALSSLSEASQKGKLPAAFACGASAHLGTNALEFHFN